MDWVSNKKSEEKRQSRYANSHIYRYKYTEIVFYYMVISINNFFYTWYKTKHNLSTLMFLLASYGNLFWSDMLSLQLQVIFPNFANHDSMEEVV